MQAAPRYDWLSTLHAQHEGRQSAYVVHAEPAAPAPESSLDADGHSPFSCAPFADTFDESPPPTVTFVASSEEGDSLLQAKIGNAIAEAIPRERSRRRMRGE